MQDYQRFDTASQNEALINEFKGNLFEYLFGLELAKLSNCEAQFMHSLSPELISRLRTYEDWLWQNDSELAEQLPRLARHCRDEFIKQYKKKFTKVLVVGKVAGGSHDQSVGEADLLLIDEHEQSKAISLKLCRKGAYVNTKSAGVRSFISKYFKMIAGSGLAQERLNLVLDESFKELSRELHLRHGLEEQDSFGVEWQEASLAVLPGALNKDDQALLYQHYFRIISVIGDFISKAQKDEPVFFNQCLATILGFAHPEQAQLTCYHHEIDKKNYQFSHCEFIDFHQWQQQLAKGKFIAAKVGQASISIEYPFGILQIRVKPMNKFTVPGLKINCSVQLKS